MSITVEGTLVVDRKKGRRGEFNIGDLSTEIGEFEVKDALIEEYEPGRYQGSFVIKWIEPDSFSWRGRVFVKNRATLEAIYIDEEMDAGDASTQVPPTPDPADTQAAPPAPVDALLATPAADAPSTPVAAGGIAPATDEAALFTEETYLAIQSGEAIKLDPTVDRVLFRSQRDALKAIGYEFQVTEQIWRLKIAA